MVRRPIRGLGNKRGASDDPARQLSRQAHHPTRRPAPREDRVVQEGDPWL
jgi:hypothetical protein